MIYVHIPFCRSFCTYCDFYSEVAAKCRNAEDRSKQDELFGHFADALTAQVKICADRITDNVNTLYIGGGTPSVLPLSVYECLMKSLQEIGHAGPYEEFTVEVNPEDIVDKGEDYVQGLMSLGVNRISMGVQSFDDKVLRLMNRRHDARTAKKAYSILENAGVRNISIDLIFGLPELSDHHWSRTLVDAVRISEKGNSPAHISAYQLSVEPGSMLATMVKKGLWKEASEDQCSSQYEMLCDFLGKAGYNHYEISNFALPGYEAVHNSAYWKHMSYVGLGPGAHSYDHVNARRYWNKEDLAAYIDDPDSVVEGEFLSPEQVALEKIMLGLRTSEGVCGEYLRAHCDGEALERAYASGALISLPGGNVRIPERMFFVSDGIISDLV